MDPVTPPIFDVKRINTVIAAVASGIVGTCFGHPLDLIKVRLQALSNTNQYKGSWDCLSQTLKNDGVQGLFRGIAPPLIGSTILNVISFSSYSLLNDIQLEYKRRQHAASIGQESDNSNSSSNNNNKKTEIKLTNMNYGLSGFGVGIFCAPAVCPIEVVKVRMQLDRKASSSVLPGSVNNAENTPRRYSGSWDCFKKVVRSEGVLGLYTGFTYTTLRDVSYSSTYFFVYEPLKQFLMRTLYGNRRNKNNEENNSNNNNNNNNNVKEGFPLLPVILSGGTSGALAWTVALPFDCVKTLIQKPDNDMKPKISAWQVVKRQYAYGGVKSFYSGWIPTILRAFAVSGVRFLVYESTVHWLNSVWKEKFVV